MDLSQSPSLNSYYWWLKNGDLTNKMLQCREDILFHTNWIFPISQNLRNWKGSRYVEIDLKKYSMDKDGMHEK